MEEAEKVGFHKKFKLESSMSTANLVSCACVCVHVHVCVCVSRCIRTPGRILSKDTRFTINYRGISHIHPCGGFAVRFFLGEKPW